MNRRIFRAGIIIGATTMIPRALGGFKEIIVASTFGRGAVLDAFLIALVVPSFVATVACTSLNPAFIPTFTRVRDSEGSDAAQNLLRATTFSGQLMMLVLTIVVAASAPYYIPWVGRGFDPPTIALACRLAQILSALIFFNGISVVWASVLNVGERFALATIAPIATPVAILAFLFIAPGWSVTGMATGMILGAAMEGAILATALHRHGIDVLPQWTGMNPQLKIIASQYIPMVAGSSLMASTVLVDQTMAASLGTGSVAALSYASKIIALLTSVGGSTLNTATLPYFSQMVARSDWSGIRHTLRTYTRLIIIATVPLTIGIIAFSRPIVHLLYERGQFTAADTRVVAAVQAMLVLQVPFHIMGLLGARLICSLRKTQFMTMVSLSNVVFNILLNWLFMHFWGIAGIALSTSVVLFVACILTFAAVYHTLRQEERIRPQPSLSGAEGAETSRR